MSDLIFIGYVFAIFVVPLAIAFLSFKKSFKAGFTNKKLFFYTLTFFICQVTVIWVALSTLSFAR